MLPFWKNTRGEWFVVGQFVLFGLVVFGPRTVSGLPPWPPLLHKFGSPLGFILIAVGLVLVFAGVFNLGRNLTPFVCPKAQATLVTGGAYRLVRHPIYSGLIFSAGGFALVVQGWLTIGFTLLLVALLDRKSRREEILLLQQIPGYAEYRRRVKRLIPFVY